MYTLKSIARRGTLFGAAAALLAATVVPSAAVFADALNPLTERSLLLSSSAPGYMNTDGSGNSADSPNAIGENYAPAGSGPNGSKTGETFTFRVSTDSTASGVNKPIKAFTLQYCTEAAGYCQAPGDNGDLNEVAGEKGDFRDGVYDADTNTTGRMTNAQAHSQGKSDLEVVFPSMVAGTDYEIHVNDAEIADYTGWTVTTANEEDDAHTGALTGKNNFITLSNASSTLAPDSQDKIEIIFNASETNYITNPGSGEFFVKINTYDSELTADHVPAVAATENTHILDGGVTVANVMTDSIHITTKVLETMQFSVGTENRDTKVVNCAYVDEATTPDCEGVGAVHGTCDPIEKVNGNRLNLGNPNAEYSLETDTAYDVYSYWRLSSNSSGGATVYYSGNTLANTVGDEIAPIGATETLSTPGTEQFGLGFVDAGTDDFDDVLDDPTTGLYVTEPDRYKRPTLLLAEGTPDVYLQPGASYDEADGNINDPDAEGSGVIEAKFAFEKTSNTVPEVIAQNNSMVISCATAKMRYVANIAADTPAGVYTTKINYLAAPQY